jgi:hypothetical protein
MVFLRINHFGLESVHAAPGGHLKIRGKLTAEEMAEAGRLLRKKTYWLRLILGNLYGFLLFAGGLIATIAGLFEHTKVNWRGVELIWLFLAAIILFNVVWARRANAKALIALNAAMPQWILLDGLGMHTSGEDGSSGSQPWSIFKNWREGKFVILIHMADGQRVNILPVSDLSSLDCESLRGLLRSQLGSAVI